MAQDERENFYRHSTLIVDDTNEVFLGLVDLHLTNESLSLIKFIENNQHAIYHLCYNNITCCSCLPQAKKPIGSPHSRILHPSQLDILFDINKKDPNHKPQNRAKHCCCPVNTQLQRDDLDLTLARCLLVNFSNVVPDHSQERHSLEKLIKFRNNTYGHAAKGTISNKEYTDNRKEIEASIMILAKRCGKEEEFRQKLKDSKVRPLDETICRQLQTSLLLYAQREEEFKTDIPSVIETAVEAAFEKFQGKQAETKKSNTRNERSPSEEYAGNSFTEEHDILPDRFLHSLAQELSVNWKDTAFQLNFNKNEIDEIKEDNTSSIVEQATTMLIKWKRRRGIQPEMIDEICHALTECGRKDLSDTLKKKLGIYKSEKVDEEDSSTGLQATASSRQISYQDEELAQLEAIENSFIETSAFDDVKKVLMDKKMVLIKGENGSGKTSLGYHLYWDLTCNANMDKDNICTNMTEFLNEYDLEETQVLLLDDVFGTLDVDQTELNKWSELMERMPDNRKKENEAGCETYMIFCSRSRLIDIIKQKEQVDCLDQSYFVDISSFTKRLSVVEKKKIFTRLWSKYHNEESQPSFINNFQFPETKHFNFWFCAEVMARCSYGEPFWKDPVNFLLNKLKHEIDSNTISSELCRKLISSYSKENNNHCLESHTLGCRFEKEEVKLCKDHPEFFKCISPDQFEFQHPLIKDKIEIHLAVKGDLVDAIRQLPLQNLMTAVLPKKGRRSLKRKEIELRLKDEHICHLIERLIAEVLKGNVKDVSSHDVWNNDDWVTMLDDILKNKSSDVKHKLLTIEDKIEGKHFLFWSALSHKRRLCEKLIRYIESCKQIENKEIFLSVTLVGACTIQKNVSIVRELIKFGADVSFCNACRIEDTTRNDEKGIESSIDEQHMCPLDISMSYGNISHVENLLKHGATISHCSWRPWQIIHKAFALGDMFVKQPVFLEAFVDVFSKYNSNKQNASPCVEKSGLYILFNEINDSCHDLKDIFLTFAKYGVLSTTLLNAFLECKVDANVTNRDKKNALHLLMDHSEGDISEKCKVIEKLLLNGCDANIKGKQRHTPLSLAIRKQYKHPQILQTLFEGNADVNIKVGEGKSLLHVCIETTMPPNDAINIIRKLKDQNCDPFLVDKKGQSVIEILFQQDEINIDILSELCRYPLHTCLEYSKIPEERKLKIIRYLHGRGMDVDCRDEKEQTPLSTAITSYCSQSIIQCLLQLGASLNLKFGNDHSILQLFLRFHPDIDGRTIKEFVNKDVHLQSGNVMVIIADILRSSKNYHFVLKTILGQFSLESTSFKSFLDEESRTFLHLTVMSELTDRECKEVSEMFINNGVDVNHRAKGQIHALDLAIRNDKVRRTSTILYLLEHSKLKEFNAKSFLSNIFDSGQICIEILSRAIDKKIINKSKPPKTKILHILAEKGLENFYKNFPNTGHTSCPTSTESNLGLPHSKSVSSKMIDMVESNVTSNESQIIKCLLECGFQIDEKDGFGRTPLHKACYCKDQDISLVTALCENGAKTNAKDLDRNTPLHSCVASESGDLNVLSVSKVLLKYAAKVEKCNNKKRTPLLLAVKQEKERIKTVTFLLSNNSDINVKDSKDESCLHYCIRKMIPDIDACKLLQILLESNPKLEHKNTLGLTALNLASTCNTFSRVSCIIRLLEKGAKVNSIDLYNRTPLFNVVRCLRGHDILLSLERIVRLAILFACHADPGYATKTNETVNDFETGDFVVKSMIREYPASEEKLVSFIYTKLQAVSKYYTEHSPKHSFKFDLKELKKEISGTVTKAIGYLGEIRFDIEEDDVCRSSDCVSSAQVAMEVNK
ncbi:uncharacterized protein LOC143085265 isoform X2 [Mytilus galloprovincialis]|uniref:uncharacterized protein LOC143085265 isoform X2 n=1 Tax=Mytilus galloprovincialis TaxID=29158 RepID=UPI003F7C2668